MVVNLQLIAPPFNTERKHLINCLERCRKYLMERHGNESLKNTRWLPSHTHMMDRRRRHLQKFTKTCIGFIY